MLTLANARIRRGSQVLLDEATVTVFRGEKVGIVGRNGCGKSTLLALIRGEVTLDAGEYGAPPRLAIATVAQDLPDTSTTLVDFVLEGDEELAAATELQQTHAGDPARDRALHVRYEALDGYTARAAPHSWPPGWALTPRTCRGGCASSPAGRMRATWRAR